MQIPYEVQARPDTGLYNAKVGIWLFLASEVMLFGGLFSAYIFSRIGSDDGYWPHGLLDVRVGTFNTAVLILSSVTVVLAWASLKMRKFADYKKWMGITVLCGALFLIIKLVVEYPAKFNHFGAIIRKDRWAKYEANLGNEHMKAKGLAPRVEISGHLHGVEVSGDKAVLEAFAQDNDLKLDPVAEHHAAEGEHKPAGEHAATAEPAFELHGDHMSPWKAGKVAKLKGVKILGFAIKPDPANEDPKNPENEKPHFWPKTPNENAAEVHVAAEDVQHWSAFVPKHSTYFSTYFMITGLHGLHVLGGVLVFAFLWGPGAALYKKNPEHMANRVEVAGLFWHFVDLIWIFVFPLFYLL